MIGVLCFFLGLHIIKLKSIMRQQDLSFLQNVKQQWRCDYDLHVSHIVALLGLLYDRTSQLYFLTITHSNHENSIYVFKPIYVLYLLYVFEKLINAEFMRKIQKK